MVLLVQLPIYAVIPFEYLNTLFKYLKAGWANVVRSCSGFCQVRVRRHESARGRDAMIDLEKKLRSGLGFGYCFFVVSRRSWVKWI